MSSAEGSSQAQDELLSIVEIPQFVEEAMARVVHNSTWPIDTLTAMVLDRMTSSFIEGEIVQLVGPGTEDYAVSKVLNGEELMIERSGASRKVAKSDVIRPQSSDINSINAQSVVDWLNEWAYVREIPGDSEPEYLWRLKKSLIKEYGLEKEIPAKYAGKVTFPEEPSISSEQDDYEPSDSEMGDLTDGAKPAVKTRRAHRQSAPVMDLNDFETIKIENLVFEGSQLNQGVLRFIFQPLDEVEKRLQADPIKLGIFEILQKAGQHGYTTDEIISDLRARHCNISRGIEEARETVDTICGNESAFFRTGEGKYALSTFLGQLTVQRLGPILGNAGALGEPTSNAEEKPSQVSKIEKRQAEALRKLSQQCQQGSREKNNFKCPKCHRIAHPDRSPLVLCDTCPKSFHMDCAGLTWKHLPSDRWCCPRCIDNAQSTLKKVLDMECKKQEAIEKAMHKEKLAEEKIKKRLSNRKSNLKQTRIKETTRAPRRNLSDSEILKEEKDSVQKMRRKLEDLKAIMEAGNSDGAHSNELDSTPRKMEQLQVELSKSLKVIEGPEKMYVPIFNSTDEFNAFNEAAGIAEFLSLYGDICELEDIFDTSKLLLSTSWPLDHSKKLVSLYSQLLLCCLLEQLNRDPPMKSRARRWTRILTNATWPEVMRRYFLSTRSIGGDNGQDGIVGFDSHESDLTGPSRGLFSDDDKRLLHESATQFSKGSWWEMSPQLQLSILGALCYDIDQGYTLKLDMGNKIQDSARISTDWGKTLTQARKLKKDREVDDKRKTSRNYYSDESDGLEDEEDDLEEEINNTLLAKEEEVEVQLQSRSFRTDCLGLDRNGRRYWWLRGSPSIILVEDEAGNHAGALTNVEELNRLMMSLMRRSPREGNLYRRLKRFYKRISSSLDGSTLKDLCINSLSRPVPKDGRQKQRDLQTLSNISTEETLNEAKIKLEEVLVELQTSEMEISTDLKGYRKELRANESAAGVCKFMLQLEAILCKCGEGLPPYSSNDFMSIFLGEEDASKLPPIGCSRSDENALEKCSSPDVQMGHTACENLDSKPTTAAKINMSSIHQVESVKEEEDEEEDEEQDEIKKLIAENPAFKALRPFIRQPHPVSIDDDLDDSDVEHTYLREKRMRKPARMWRSGRERAVWLKTVLHAASVTDEGASSVQATYAAFVLADRTTLLIERCLALEKEIARWEAEEAERQRLELLRKTEEVKQVIVPRERPMMIRTGKAKTENGVKIVLKLIGRDPFPQGRNATSAMDTMASEQDVSRCSWGYQCSVCLLAGDLLCCEHGDGCAVSVHPDCTGQPFPVGKWICTNHDESNLKTRVRKRAEQTISKGAANGSRSLIEPDPLASLVESSEDESSSSSSTSSSSSSSDDDSDYQASARPRKKQKP